MSNLGSEQLGSIILGAESEEGITAGYGQAQAQIKQTYYGHGQAQADIKQTYFGLGQCQGYIVVKANGFGQCQATIKGISRAFGQANADIKQTYPLCTITGGGNGAQLGDFVLGESQLGSSSGGDTEEICLGAFGQAQAKIDNQPRGCGQCQADIKQVYYVHGQCQADIKQVYYAFAQCQADIKNTYYGHGQCQATIFGNGYGFGQCQADIKATNNGHGQCQADIKQTYYQSGQCQAYIVNTYFAHGQCQAQIKNTYYAHAQCQADIKATNRAFGQCQGLINTSCDLLYDTFTRTLSGSVGTPNTGPAWTAYSSPDDIQFADVDGSRLVVDISQDPSYTWIWIRSPFSATHAEAYIEFTTPNFDTTQAYLEFGLRDNTGSGTYVNIWYGYADGSWNPGTNLITLPTFNFTLENNETYGFKFYVADSRVKAKVWKLSDPEPFTYNYDRLASLPPQAGGFYIYADGSNGESESWYFDNICVSTVTPVIAGYGQCQAKILQPYGWAFGQAQGRIRLPAGFGQCQAKIAGSTVTYKHGQCQALINVPIKQGQAQADIRTFDNNKSGQARAFIIAHRRWFGQAQARIIGRPFGWGQAQGLIHRTQGYGQCQALIIKQTGRGFGQAQAWIKHTKNSACGQAQGTITAQQQTTSLIFQDTYTRTTSEGVLGTPDLGAYTDSGPFGSFYDKVHIDGSKLVLESDSFDDMQIDADVNILDTITYVDFMFPAAADSDIVDLYGRIHNPGGRFIAVEILNSPPTSTLALFGNITSSPSVELDELESGTWYTLKLSIIGSTVNGKIWKRDEAEPDWMITATTDSNGNGSGLTEIYMYGGDDDAAAISYLDNWNVYTQISIPPTAWGQAQGYIFTTLHIPHGQAQAYIRPRVGLGQCQATIKKAIRVHGQAQAYIVKSWKFGQAQAKIIHPSFAHGLCQAYIRKGQATGQCQARIITTFGRAVGQCQAKILKAQATQGYGQAKAYIKGPAFGQAAALIYSPVYLVRYNSYDLPGYAQEEDISSISRMKVNNVIYLDGSLTQYTGLENKMLSLRMKVIGPDYLNVKLQAQKAATIVRSAPSWTKLYIQYWDRHYEALTSKISFENTAKNSRTLDYSLEFETKPWLIGDAIYTINGSSTLTTTGRTLADGGFTPAKLVISGTDVTISGYTSYGHYTGYVSISGTVTNFEIDSEAYSSTDNRFTINPDYVMYVGPGETTFEIANATNVTISWRNRWYL